MKRTNTILMTMLLMAGMGLASCGKDDNGNADNTNGGTSDNPGTEQPAPTPTPTPTPEPQPTVTWVDLGLPSGVQWASCNVGASAPEEPGNFYAWGETTTKSSYSWSNYAYGQSYLNLTKYCCDANYGLNGFTDDLVALLPGDDAATANLGSTARIPTRAEWAELIDNTSWQLTTQNEVVGFLFTADNGNTLFLPAAGRWSGDVLYFAGSAGYYWSASLLESHPYYAWCFNFDDEGTRDLLDAERCGGLPVRPVCSAQ